MANSKRFNQLAKRIIVIENSYLPVVNPLGNYSKKEQDDLRAYVLLVHAEIESYFEEVSESKAKEAFHKWKIDRSKSNVLLALLSFCEHSIKNQELEDRIHKSLSFYIGKLKVNHGIKEKNILDILLPVGIEYGDLDATWLSVMSSFGSIRGQVAHSTAVVQSPLDPSTLKHTVTLIQTEIEKIDGEIKKIK